MPAPKPCTCRGESLSAQTTGPVSGTPRQPRRATHTTRIALTWLARWFDWRQALAIVQPATLIRWHRQGFRLFWRWKSNLDGPRSRRTCKGSSAGWPVTTRRGARSGSPTNSPQAWPARVATHRAEVSAQAPRRWMASTHPVSTLADLCAQSCKAIVACDFCVVVTATFRSSMSLW